MYSEAIDRLLKDENGSPLLKKVLEKEKKRLEEGSGAEAHPADEVKAFTQSLFRRLEKRSEELKKGSEEMKKGSEELKKGSEEMKKGSEELKKGSEEMKKGSEEMKKGSEEMKKGSEEMKKGSEEMKKGSEELKKGSEELKDSEEGTANNKGTANTTSKGTPHTESLNPNNRNKKEEIIVPTRLLTNG